MNNNLIILEQLPVIKYHLEQLSIEIKEKVDRANSLYVGEETIKDVKKVRADLTKEFNELETQRKAVKQAIMSKYDEFEEIYKENVSNLYKQADMSLKEKIDNVESQLKLEKEQELREFAEQHFKENKMDLFVTFEDIHLNITLSASIKSLKEQILDFVNKLLNDKKLIDMEEYKDEILLEYKNSLNFVDSKMKVVERHKQLEELKQQQEEKLEQEKQEEAVVEKVDEAIEEVSTPKEIIEDDEVIVVQFNVKGKKSKIVELKNKIIELGLEWY